MGTAWGESPCPSASALGMSHTLGDGCMVYRQREEKWMEMEIERRESESGEHGRCENAVMGLKVERWGMEGIQRDKHVREKRR